MIIRRLTDCKFQINPPPDPDIRYLKDQAELTWHICEREFCTHEVLNCTMGMIAWSSTRGKFYCEECRVELPFAECWENWPPKETTRH